MQTLEWYDLTHHSLEHKITQNYLYSRMHPVWTYAFGGCELLLSDIN